MASHVHTAQYRQISCDIISSFVSSREYPSFEIVWVLFLSTLEQQCLPSNISPYDVPPLHWLLFMQRKLDAYLAAYIASGSILCLSDIERDVLLMFERFTTPSLSALVASLNSDPNEIDTEEAQTYEEWDKFGIGSITLHPLLRPYFSELADTNNCVSYVDIVADIGNYLHSTDDARAFDMNSLLAYICDAHGVKRLSQCGVCIHGDLMLEVGILREIGVARDEVLWSGRKRALEVPEQEQCEEPEATREARRRSRRRRRREKEREQEVQECDSASVQLEEVAEEGKCGDGVGAGDGVGDGAGDGEASVTGDTETVCVEAKGEDDSTSCCGCSRHVLNTTTGAVLSLLPTSSHNASTPPNRDTTTVTARHVLALGEYFPLHKGVADHMLPLAPPNRHHHHHHQHNHSIHSKPLTGGGNMVVSSSELASILPWRLDMAQHSAKAVGHWGEALVHRYLLATLPSTCTVSWVNELEESNAAYDLKVYDGGIGGLHGTVFVDVKSTWTDDRNVFFLSLDEWQFITGLPKVQYDIYRVYNAGDPSRVRVVIYHDVERLVKERKISLCLAV
jgi:hypothetical protein